MFCFRDRIHFCGSKFKRPKGVYNKIFLFLIFCLKTQLVGSELPNQGSNPCPLPWENSPNHYTHREFPVLILFTDNHWIFPKGTIVISLILHNGFCILIILGGGCGPFLMSLSNLLQYYFCFMLGFLATKLVGS